MSMQRITSPLRRAAQLLQEMETKSSSGSSNQQQQPQQHLLLHTSSQEPSLVDQLNIKFNDEEKILESLKLIENTFRIFKPEETMLCFNGGKDCSVLLHILKKFHDHLKIPKIDNLYIRSADPFEEIEEYVTQIAKDYKLKLHEYTGNQKSALRLTMKNMPKLKAVFMGSRRTDPHCENYHICMVTDGDWPMLLRIFPLLEWSYKDVWHYLLANNVPYCQLYDKGYTSLGDKGNTSVNAELLYFNDVSNQYEYKPAYKLENIAMERTNRKIDSVNPPNREDEK